MGCEIATPYAHLASVHPAHATHHITGDEIRLKHPCPNIGAPPWTGSGLVVRLNETSEEVRFARTFTPTLTLTPTLSLTLSLAFILILGLLLLLSLCCSTWDTSCGHRACSRC